MKKLIALVIAAIMVISMIPVMAISTAAAEVEGDWTTYRAPSDYEVEEGEAFCPAPGYTYTDEGFTTIAADWTNHTPFFTAQTKESQPLKDGFYMQVRIDEYAYGGEDGAADHWISFNLSDRENVAPGNIVFGNNWLTLIRGAGEGSASAQSFVTTMTTDEAVGNFGHKGDVAITVPMDDNGREIYTFEVTFDGTNYDIKVCGTSVQGIADINTKLNEWNENGEFWVGVTLHCGISDATQGLTILKVGTSAEDAITPVGSDSAEPEDNLKNFGEKIDASTVDANTPALLWDATKPTFKKDPEGVDIKLVAQGDNSYHITATGPAPYWQWGIKSELTYSIADFPVFSMVLKNFWGDNGGIYYCAGEVMSCRDDYKTSWSIFDEGCMMFGENEEYSLVVVDLAEYELIDDKMLAKDGRIHNVRPFFSVTDTSDPEICEWDVMYMGWFRSVEEAQQYAKDRLQMAPVTEAPETEAPETQAPAADTQAPSADTQAPSADTQAPAGTGSVETNGTTEPAKKGCGSVIGFSAVAIMAAAAAAVALKKKD